MLKISGLHKTFNAGSPNETKALRDIDLQVEKGEFVVVLGTNGSGKSTLQSAIAGTFLPDGGTIFLDDRDITSMPEHSRAPWIGRVFQNPYSGTAADMSIAENLALAAMKGLPRGLGWALSAKMMKEMKARVRSLDLGLENRLSEPMGGLSGGERQALTLLMATWNRPSLLLLDEHTSALDPRMAASVIRLSQDIINSLKPTTLMVTHSLQQAIELGDRLLMMHQGGVKRDFRGEEKKKLTYEDLRALFEEVRRESPDLPDDPQHLSDRV